MIQFSLHAAKEGFFDRAKVQRAVDAANRRVLSQFGAFVRQRAKTSVRKRKGTSPPGSPPYSHTGFLRKSVLFAYDRARNSVVIGPVLLRAGSRVATLLEHGGEGVVKTRDGKTKRAKFRPRPFMGPAFAAEREKLPDLWRNSVR